MKSVLPHLYFHIYFAQLKAFVNSLMVAFLTSARLVQLCSKSQSSQPVSLLTQFHTNLLIFSSVYYLYWIKMYLISLEWSNTV